MLYDSEQDKDATLIFGHDTLLQGHMIFSSMFMFDRFESSNKLNIDT